MIPEESLKLIEIKGIKTKYSTCIPIQFGIIFLLLNSAFNSFRNFCSKLYDDMGYYRQGQIIQSAYYFGLLFAAFLLSALFTNLSYKLALFLGGIGHFIFVCSGIPLSICFEQTTEGKQYLCNDVVLFYLPIFFGILGGMSRFYLMNAQLSFLIAISKNDSMGSVFGIFSIFDSLNLLLSGILITFLANFVSNTVFFVIVSAILLLSCLLFLMIPSVNEIPVESGTSWENAKSIAKCFCDKKMNMLVPLFLFMGLLASVIGNALYLIIDENKERTSYVMILLGLMSPVGGQLTGFLQDKLDLLNTSLIANIASEIMLVMSYFVIQEKNYIVTFFIASFLGYSVTGGFIILERLWLAHLFGNRIDSFSFCKIFKYLGTFLGSLMFSFLNTNRTVIYGLVVINFFQIIWVAFLISFDFSKSPKRKEMQPNA